MRVIESPANPTFKQLKRLRKASHRRRLGRFLVEGERENRLAIRNGCQLIMGFVIDSSRLPWPEDLAIQLPSKLMAQVSVRDNNPCLGLYQYPDFSSSIPMEAKRIVAIDGVEKPGNLGAFFRCADGAGIDQIAILDETVDPYSPHAIRASLGSVFGVPFSVHSRQSFKEQCDAQGRTIYLASPEAGQSLYDTVFTDRCCVVLGSEAFGLNPWWHGQSVEGLAIPMRGQVDSLNLSVAGALVCYELTRQ